MVDFRPVLLVIGLLLSTLGVAMLVPAMVDAAADNPDWRVFLGSSATCLFVGVALLLTNRIEAPVLDMRQAFLLITLTWVVIAAFGALPFVFSNLQMAYTDAFFEAMSGVTTTGSTVITGLDFAPPGILLWRSILQWMGGIGIIIMAIAALPALQVGGMQLFRLESFDTDKILPRAAQISGVLSALYVSLTMLCGFALWAAGMTPLEAAVHAMTTLSTGGYSTSDASVGHFDSAVIDYLVLFFMVVASLPFILYVQMARGHRGALFKDSQVQWFLAVIASIITVMTLWQWLGNGTGAADALRYASFNVVSIITGTGYVTTDYSTWGGFAVAVFFFVMFIGGCAGSTTCGIKIFRVQVLFAATNIQLKRLLQPHGVFTPRYNGKPLPESVISSVMSYLFLFAVCYGVLVFGLAALGLDFLTAVSGAATAMANVGPALGDIIGPEGNFQSLPDAAKWLLSLGMLLGRLELFTVLVLFSPAFWRA